MDSNINLLSNKTQVAENGFPRILRWVAISLMTIVVVVSLLLFFLKVNSKIPTLKAEQARLTAQLTTQSTKTAKYLLLNDRLKNSAEIINNRPVLMDKLKVLKQDVPLDVQVQNFSISKKEFSLTVTSPSLEAMNTYLNRVEENTAKDPIFSFYSMQSLTFDEKNNRYSITSQGGFKK